MIYRKAKKRRPLLENWKMNFFLSTKSYHLTKSIAWSGGNSA